MQNFASSKNNRLSPLEAKLSGTFGTRFALELFGNTAHFTIANILFELLVEGITYLRIPDLYVLLLATLLQAYFLTRWQNTPQPRRFWGNLIAPALYTLGDTLLEGLCFFSKPQHIAYWGFALAVGTLQAWSPHLPRRLGLVALLLENVTRASILFFMYALFEIHANPAQTTSISAFFADSAHQFIAFFVLLLGLSVGLANLTAQYYLGLLQQTSAQLKIYSEWLLGRDLLNRIIADPNALTLVGQERTVLFMDIRGFTGWSETRPPDKVATLLNQYYHVAEAVLSSHKPIKFKFSADEVLAVFATADSAVDAAMQLCAQVNQLLADQNLGVGIGLHTGEVAEGLLGSSDVKFYDVIGDVVNVAKRIESSARSGEILISDNVRLMLDQTVHLGAKREITVKGKPEPLTVYTLEESMDVRRQAG